MQGIRWGVGLWYIPYLHRQYCKNATLWPPRWYFNGV